MELVQEEPHRRSERGGIGLRARMVQPYTLTDAPGSDACIIGVEDGTPQLGKAQVENVHFGIKIALAPGKGKSKVGRGPERLWSHYIGDGGAKVLQPRLGDVGGLGPIQRLREDVGGDSRNFVRVRDGHMTQPP